MLLMQTHTPPSAFIRRFDIFFCGILLILSLAVHTGRMGASINGVDLTTDAANYAAMAAAVAHPESFTRDDAFADPAVYGSHVTSTVPFISALATDDNYGLAYLKLTGVHIFFHYITFYILGIVLLKQRWQAACFTLLMGQAYWIFWGTYWGGGYLDYTPRTTFEVVYPLFICAALALLRRPRWWPLFMGCCGLMVYVHSISALPAALGFWLGFALCRPTGVSLARHMAWMLFCGGCFLAAMGPFALSYLKPAPSLSSDDIAMLREVLLLRYDAEFTYYWQALGRYFLHYFILPLFPVGLAGGWILHRWGTAEEKAAAGQFAMWTLGVLGVVGLFILDQETALRLGRHHYEFDLIRCLRFLLFFAMCTGFMGINVLLRILPPQRVWQRRLAALAWAGLFLGLFIGGQSDQTRISLLWFWNKLDSARYEEAYGPQLQRAAMIEALKTYTEPGAAIFYPEEDLAIRHNALRSLTHSWKDVGIFYYGKNIDKLRQWNRIHQQLLTSPTAYIDVARQTGADYLLSKRPQDRALLEKQGPVVWSGDGYVLIRIAPSPAAPR